MSIKDREPPHREENETGTPPQMQDAVFYDLNPRVIIDGAEFSRIQCHFRVPDKPNEYVVSGIPVGGTEVQQFVLRFTDRGTTVNRATDQEFAKTRLKLV